MTYEEFNDFIMFIYNLSGEEQPAFSIIRDLFDFIDVKKDGVIDKDEWCQTFSHLPV